METPKISAACPNPSCGARFSFKPEQAGKKVRCSRCKQAFRVPAAEGGESPAPAEEPAASAAPAPEPQHEPAGYHREPSWIERITLGRRRWRTGIAWTLAVSFGVHLAITPLVPQNSISKEQLASMETEYSRKIAAAKRAGQVAKELKNKITMPPPPPDPESVVSNTLSQSLSTDIEKVVGNLLDVDVTSKLTKQVTASLKDELNEAAKDIAAGKLSEEEIKKLHEKFKAKAHETTVKALREHRIETQVERAKLSTQEWYQNDVSVTLFRNMTYEMFHVPHQNSVWAKNYVSYVKGANHGVWGFVALWFGDRWDYRRSLGTLEGLLQGRYYDPRNDFNGTGKKLQHHQVEFLNWPEPSAEAADILAKLFAGLYKDEKGKEWWSWRYDRYVADFHPHKDPAQLAAGREKLVKLWDQAAARVEAYRDQAPSASPAEMKDLQKACLEALKQVHAAMNAVTTDEGACEAISRALRVKVLRGPMREEMYEYLMSEWTRELQAIIRDFARSQFKKGIIVHKDGVDQAMKEFQKEVVPLLRADLEKLIPKKRFDELVFLTAGNPYKSKVTGEGSDPGPEDEAADQKAMADTLAKRPDLQAYVPKREEAIKKEFRAAIDGVREDMMQRVLTGGLLMRQMSSFVEGVDYADKVQEKLDARQAALKGRGQDLAKLTEDGIPDTSAPLIALLYGASKGHGANLEPVVTELAPAYLTKSIPERSLRGTNLILPPHPMKWGFEEQAEIKPTFQTARSEGIPFLTQHPHLDGDLSDWGKVRPLVLKPAGKDGPQEPLLVYAAWNYQGFFFGYRVKQHHERFYFPSLAARGKVTFKRVEGVGWAYFGDNFRVCFDTLDARNKNRGEPHTQEFVIFPRGTDTDPLLPGIERVIASQRDAKSKEYRGVKDTCTVFPQQPPDQMGPDGTGPFRITTFEPDGYTTEIFIPRSLLNVPVFAPGWYLGFDCAVAVGFQSPSNGRARFQGCVWAAGHSDAEQPGLYPEKWGDLLLLGTDPRLIVQQADESGGLANAVLPGHSYLITVIDPDRNVSLAVEDTVLVSAEVAGGHQDVEVFMLKETEKNSGIFRGYVNTQPGQGREVQGVLEVMPGWELRLGYVDFANAKGERNVISEMKLPVVSGLMHLSEQQGE